MAGAEAGIRKRAKELPAPLVNWAAGFGPPGVSSHCTIHSFIKSACIEAVPDAGDSGVNRCGSLVSL